MRTVVVGGGVSGAHAALTLLERGHRRRAVGRRPGGGGLRGTGDHFPRTGRATCPTPSRHFLGADLGALIPPATAELLRYPPSRQFLASPDDPLWGFESDGFFPYGSFAKGGLANGWGANALSFDADDLAGWPVSDFRNGRGVQDRLSAHSRRGPDRRRSDAVPAAASILRSPPCGCPSPTSDCCSRTSAGSRSWQKSGMRIGQARLAVIDRRVAQRRLRLLRPVSLGMPEVGDLQSPSDHARAVRGHGRFRYVSGRLVLALLSGNHRILGIRYLDTATQQIREEPCDVVFLAAGALQTGAIFLRTLKAARARRGASHRRADGYHRREDPLRVAGERRPPSRPAVVPVQPADIGHDRGLGAVASLSPRRAPPSDEPALLPVDRAHALRQPALEEALLRPPIGARRGDPLLPGPDRARQPSGARRRSAAGGTPFVSRYRETADKEHYIRRSVSRVRSALWHLGCLPQRRRALPCRSGDSLRRDRADGQRAEAMRSRGTIQPLSRISTSPMARPSRRCPASRSRCRWPPTRPALREAPSFRGPP